MSKINPLIYNTIKEMQEKGMTNSEIMAQLHITYSRLRQILDAEVPEWDIGKRE